MSTINETTNRLQISKNSVLNSVNSGQGKDKLEKKDFMNLFMYELANQNPLDPMDSSKMMASLAQLGGMEQMQSMNNALKDISKSQQQMIQLNSIGYLNQNIQVKDNFFDVKNSKTEPLNFQLDRSAAKVSLNVMAGIKVGQNCQTENIMPLFMPTIKAAQGLIAV